MPLWLNEGMAEFFQNTDIHDKYVDLGEPSANDILYLRQQQLLSLATLFKVNSTSPYYHEEQKGSVFYSESWALTQYLEITDKQANTHRLSDYVDLMSKHEDPITAAAQAFGDLNQLQKDLETYVTRGNYSFFRLKASTAIDPSSFQVKALTLAQANAFRADLLACNQRTQEARALLDTVLRDDPNNSLAHETMGFLSLRAGDLAAAQKWYEQAVGLDPQSCLAHYYFASIAMQAGSKDNDAAVEAGLRAAIKLNPSFAPAYDRLAVFYGSRKEQLDEAYALSLHAIQLDPAVVGYRMNAANILVQEDQYQYAINVLTAAAKVARTPEEIAALQNRLRELQDHQARREEAAKDSQPIAETLGVPATDTSTHRSAVGPVSLKHPSAPATGTKHTMTGVIRDVRCSYPAVIEFKVEAAGKSVDVYSDNYFKLDFTTADSTPKGNLHPCADLQGLTAVVQYAEVPDKTVDGQISSVELRK
jgi:tetratricopeptide (TPR) repeat protein